MEEKEQLSESVFRSISDGLIVIAQDGTIADLNVPAAYALDITAKDKIGKHFFDNLNNAELENQMVDFFAEPDVYSTKRFEIASLERGYSVSFDPIFSGKHERQGVLIVLHDITDERNLIKAKDELLWASSHEFYTPLAAIRGNLEYLRGLKTKEEIVSSIDDVKSSVSDAYEGFLRVLKLAQDTLDIASVETARVNFSMKSFDLAKIVKLAAEKTKPKLEDKRIELEADIKPVKARGDEGKAYSIVAELIDNAVKFTDKGKVFIKVYAGDRAFVEVSDTGIGIDAEKATDLFTKFGRLNPTLTAHRGGVGLGLYKAKLFAEGMGAEIQLKTSKLGKGSTFILSMIKG